jgi:hypothetical protein
MVRRTFIYLAGFCAFTLSGCTPNNQLMIRPTDGVLTYCSPLEQGSKGYPPDTLCIGKLEALGFTKGENVSLAGGGGIYLSDDGRVLSSKELAALSPNIPPQNHSFPPETTGLKAGDTILAVNGVMAKTRSEIVPHLIGRVDQHVTVRIRRNNLEQDVTMGFKPWPECDGDIFDDQRFFFHFEYARNILAGIQ